MQNMTGAELNFCGRGPGLGSLENPSSVQGQSPGGGLQAKTQANLTFRFMKQ